MAWVKQMGKTEAQLSGSHSKVFRRAARPDNAYGGSATVAVRRLVYRVRFIVPGVFRERRAPLAPEAAELHVDVSDSRLRARFLGSGWPVPKGSEVRLRVDVPGVYVVDGEGGRWLGSGELAAWFDGKVSGRPQSQIRIRRDFSVTQIEDYGPGPLLCALLAEWTNQSRDALEPRCRRGAIPPGFRFGPWSAELMAVVPMRLPQHDLRADEKDPPSDIASGTTGTILSKVDMAALGHAPTTASRDAKSTTEGVQHGLRVTNESDGRAVLLVSGVPIGWLDASTSTTFSVPSGRYHIGAMRPLGLLRLHPKSVDVPAHVTVPMPRHLAR